MIEYALTRSKRKTVALYIRNGVLDVRAPLKMPIKAIEEFIESKEKWITERLSKSQAQTERREKFSLDYGSLIYYRGNQYPITAKDGTRVGFDGECFYMPPSLAPEQIKSTCIKIYRKLAKQYLTEQVLNFAQKLSVEPKSVSITNARTRWGSCSAKKTINLTWRLIMACDEVSSYVACHECSHMLELNHSRRFWAIVENAMPDYKQRQAMLKGFQYQLNGEDW